MRFYFYSAKITIMSAFKRLLHFYPNIRWWACLLILVSLVFSRFLLSVGMIALTLTAVLHPDVKLTIKKWISTPYLIVWALLVVVYLVSGIYSGDKATWIVVMQKKAPFLFLPLAFAAGAPLQRKAFMQLLLAYVLLLIGACSYALLNYALHYETITTNYIYGQVMPTPVDHIRFSLLIVIAIATCAYCAFVYFKENQSLWAWLYVAGGVYLFAFIHLLAVRSGLLALYLILLYTVLAIGIQQKKWKWSILLLSAMLVIGWTCFTYVPSLRTKIKYMEYDWYSFFTGANVNGKSDGGRLLSMKIAKELIVEHPWLGVGAGDLETDMKAYYAVHYPEISPEHRMVPHNEFLYMWLACGIAGPLALLVVVGYLLFSYRLRRNWLYVAVLVVTISSLFTEPVLEIQIGTAIFVFFPLLFYQQMKPETAL